MSHYETLSKPPQKGRGALGNPTGRFEKIEVVYNPDPDWPSEWQQEDEAQLKTQYFKDNTQSILSYNDSPDISFNTSINPYRGCEHGCIYCYARPTHEYLGLSGGLDFESKIFVKTNAAELLTKELSKKSWQPQVIVMSGVTDPYQPIERELKITRQCLEVLHQFHNPVGIITKNYLVTRDKDFLSELSQLNAAKVFISLTTLDDTLARVMEPRTAQPQQRLKAIEELASAGICVSVMMGPIIPGLTDHEIDPLLKAASEAGAQSAHYTLLRLPWNNKDLFEPWLKQHFPDRKNRVMNRLKEMRDGEVNDTRFGMRMRGEGNYAQYIEQLFRLAKKRYALDQPLPSLSTEHFRVPSSTAQLSLF